MRPTPFLALISALVGVLMVYSLLTSKADGPVIQRGLFESNDGDRNSKDVRDPANSTPSSNEDALLKRPIVDDADGGSDEDERGGKAVLPEDENEGKGSDGAAAVGWLKRAYSFIFNDEDPAGLEDEKEEEYEHIDEGMLIGGNGSGTSKTKGIGSDSDSNRGGAKTKDIGGSIAEVYDTTKLKIVYPRPQHNMVGITVLSRAGTKSAAQRTSVQDLNSDEMTALNERLVWAVADFAGAFVPPQRNKNAPTDSMEGVDTNGWAITQSSIVKEAALFADHCATHTGFGDIDTDGRVISSPKAPSLSQLSTNPNTAHLLSMLPLEAQAAIAQQNYYYDYLQNSVFQLNTSTGMWGIKPTDQAGPGIIQGAWSMFVRHPDAMDRPVVTAGGTPQPASQPLSDSLPDEVQLTHWENTASAQKEWYRYVRPSNKKEESPAASNKDKGSAVQSPNATGINVGICPKSKAVPFPITTPLLVERLANKRLLFLGDSLIRNTFVTTIARVCNFRYSDKCMTRMPTYEYDIDKKESHRKGPIGCVPLNRDEEVEQSSEKQNDKRDEVGNAEEDLATSLEASLTEALDKFQGRWEGGESSAKSVREQSEQEVEEAIKNVLSPCYQHANFYFRPIHRLTLKGATKDPNARRQLTKGDLIPPTINVEFPLINLTLIHVSVVKPKLIHTVARHIGFLSYLRSKEASNIAKGYKNGTALHLHVRSFVGRGGARPKKALPVFSERGYDVPKAILQPFGHLSNLDAILVSIGPHLKLHDVMASVHTYPDSIAALREATSAAIIVCEYTHVLHTHPSYAFVVDKISEVIKVRLALMQPDPPMFIPQRFVTQFMFRLRDNSNVSAESSPKNRPRNSYHARHTSFGVRGVELSFDDGIGGGPVFGPNPSLPDGHPSVSDRVPLSASQLSKFDWLRYYSPAVAAEGGSLTGIAGCGFYDNQHPAMRCHTVLSELTLGGLLVKLASRDMALDAAVATASPYSAVGLGE